MSFISFRKTRAQRGVQDGLIHCCAEHSQYDPRAARRCCRARPSSPCAPCCCTHDPKADTLTAYATLGGELFDEFFRKYEMKLSLDVGPKAKNAPSAAARSVVRELERLCAGPPRAGRSSADPGLRVGPAPVRGGRSPNPDSFQSFASRSSAARSVSSFLAKQKRTTCWSKPSP